MGCQVICIAAMIVLRQKVNGETISQQDFLNRYNQEFEARAQQEGESF